MLAHILEAQKQLPETGLGRRPNLCMRFHTSSIQLKKTEKFNPADPLVWKNGWCQFDGLEKMPDIYKSNSPMQNKIGVWNARV